jgi:hypothetical protein
MPKRGDKELSYADFLKKIETQDAVVRNPSPLNLDF